MDSQENTILRLPPELIINIISHLTAFQIIDFSQTCKLALAYCNDRVRLLIPYSRREEGVISEMHEYLHAFRHWIFRMGISQRLSMRDLVVMPTLDLGCAVTRNTIELTRWIVNACVLASRGDLVAFEFTAKKIQMMANSARRAPPQLGDARRRCYLEACRDYEAKACECADRGETAWFELFASKAETLARECRTSSS